MDGEKDLEDLQSNPLFLDLKPDIVGTLVEHGEVCDFAAASYLIRQGKAGTSIFLIQEGSVSVVVEVSGNRKTVLLRDLRRNEGVDEDKLNIETPDPKEQWHIDIRPWRPQ